MEKILIHCPLNISRSLTNMVKEFVEQEYGKDVFELVNEQHRPDSESALLSDLRQGNTPILYIGQAIDFGRFTEEEIADNFETMHGLPLRKELSELGFKDIKRFFQVFTVVPFTIIFNKNIAERLPSKWSDFLGEHYEGRVRLPVKQLAVSKVAIANMRGSFNDEYKKFLKNSIFEGSPIDVVNAVDNGEYEFGIVNISFSRISRYKNTGIIWIPQGAYCMPLVIAIRKGALENVAKIVEYIFSDEIQSFLGLQSFIPASSKVELPDLIKENQCNIIWDGWENFLNSHSNKITD